MAPRFVPLGKGAAADAITRTGGHAAHVPGGIIDCDSVWCDAGAAEPFLWRGWQHYHLLHLFYFAARGHGLWRRRRMAALAGGMAAQYIFQHPRPDIDGAD